MSNLWVTFSTDSSGSFTELSGNIIYNLNNLYNFNGNLVDTTSDFIIYELSNNPIQRGVSLQANNWKQLNLNTILNPFQGYWLGGINTNLPLIFLSKHTLSTAVNSWITNPIPVTNKYGLIENWDVGNVTDMNSMFNGATSFNGNISNWDVGNVTAMNNMFNGAISFNQDLNEWNVGNVTTMSQMFYGATSFTGNISNWDVGNVTNMYAMFGNATSFNGNISNWDVGNVTNMYAMFGNATSFNGNISNWNVGNVTDMNNMFDGASSFNQDISNWDVRNVTAGNFNEMFKDVTFFTDMSNQIHSNGTPFNYFISQKNTTISVSIRGISLINYSDSDGPVYSDSNGPVLALTETFSDGDDSDVNRIVNALPITTIYDLFHYSFTYSEDSISISRDILSLWFISYQSFGNVYYYKVSGTNPSYYSSGEVTLNFTRRT